MKVKLHDASGHLWKEVDLPSIQELPKIIIIHNNSIKGVQYFWRVQQTLNTYNEVLPYHISRPL